MKLSWIQKGYVSLYPVEPPSVSSSAFEAKRQETNLYEVDLVHSGSALDEGEFVIVRREHVEKVFVGTELFYICPESAVIATVDYAGSVLGVGSLDEPKDEEET